MKEDLKLKIAFANILSSKHLDNVSTLISEKFYENGIDTSRSDILEVLQANEIKDLEELKERALELVIKYTNVALSDNYLSTSEKLNILYLKRLLKIKEGDFYKKYPHIHDEVQEIIRTQLSLIYRNDDKIDDKEAVQKVDLQDIFDLSYDEFLEISNLEDIDALDRGAELKELDTVLFEIIEKSDAQLQDRHISQKVKELVWNRDRGRCVKCGKQENLEFDHIIPFSKGGGNTYRNVRLLCKHCCRVKNNGAG